MRQRNWLRAEVQDDAPWVQDVQCRWMGLEVSPFFAARLESQPQLTAEHWNSDQTAGQATSGLSGDPGSSTICLQQNLDTSARIPWWRPDKNKTFNSSLGSASSCGSTRHRGCVFRTRLQRTYLPRPWARFQIVDAAATDPR